MSALDTTVRVLDWAVEPQGPPPTGSLLGFEALATPGPAAQTALGRLAVATAARLGLSPPPLGDATPPSGSGLILALGIGAAQHPLAAELLSVADSPRCVFDLLVRHGLALGALADLPPLLAERLHALSPLTALLTEPLPGDEGVIGQLAERWLAHPEGRRVLVQQFSDPNATVKSLTWRGDVLERLRLAPQYQGFVLDVYETALALHRPEWQVLTQEALYSLNRRAPSPDVFKKTGAVARWWQPLRGLYRSHVHWLRERAYLDFNLYLQGIKLAQIAAPWGVHANGD